MQFTISKTELQTALNIAGKCVGGNILPAHSNYLFAVTKNQLSVSATDGERLMTYTTNIDSDGEWVVQLPVRELSEMVKELPEQPLIFSLKGAVVQVEYIGGKFELPFEKGDEYPVALHKEKFNFDTSSEQFLTGLGRVLFATSQDVTRPALMGVLLEFGKSGMNITAANGPVLSTVHSDGKYKDATLLITQKTVTTLTSIPVNETINISIGETSIIVKPNDQTSLWCRVIDDKFPAYRNFLPKDNDKLLVVDRTHLLSALKRSRVFGKSVEDMLLVTMALGEQITIATTNLKSQAINEQITGSYTGDDMTLDFNCKHLINCLSKCDTETVYLRFKDFKSAFTITEADEPGETLMLTMPYSK